MQPIREQKQSNKWHASVVFLFQPVAIGSVCPALGEMAVNGKGTFHVALVGQAKLKQHSGT